MDARGSNSIGSFLIHDCLSIILKAKSMSIIEILRSHEPEIKKRISVNSITFGAPVVSLLLWLIENFDKFFSRYSSLPYDQQ
jgi:hypothetical protein